jgi:hypothetical protein
MKRLLIPLFLFVLLGAGCFGSGSDTKSPEASPVKKAFESGNSEFGNAATSSVAVSEPKVWSADGIYSKQLTFDSPKGYWVYQSEMEHDYWLIPGEVPEPGSDDPANDIRDTRVATVYPLQFIPDSFPTWDRFKIAMAQFQCVEGTTEDNLIGCLSKPSGTVTGETISGLPYESFKLQVVRQKDQAPQGWQTYIVVRLGEENDHGVLIAVDDDAAMASVVQFAKSMRIDTGEE